MLLIKAGKNNFSKKNAIGCIFKKNTYIRSVKVFICKMLYEKEFGIKLNLCYSPDEVEPAFRLSFLINSSFSNMF
jgi:hypothetical protein